MMFTTVLLLIDDGKTKKLCAEQMCYKNKINVYINTIISKEKLNFTQFHKTRKFRWQKTHRKKCRLINAHTQKRNEPTDKQQIMFTITSTPKKLAGCSTISTTDYDKCMEIWKKIII